MRANEKSKLNPRAARSRLVVATAAVAGVTLVESWSFARPLVNASWVSAVSGSWTDPARWSSGPNFPNNEAPPGTTYNAIISAGPTPYTVDFNTQAGVVAMTMDSANATLAIAGGTLTVGGAVSIAGHITQTAGAVTQSASNVIINLHGAATWDLSGGTLSAGSFLVIGALAADAPVFTLSGTGVITSNQLNVGTNAGDGTFVHNAGRVTLGNYLSLADSNTSTTLNGSYALGGGTLTTPIAFVGTSGNGTFTQTAGLVTVTSFLSIADLVGSHGSYTMSGGIFDSAADVVGHFGSATFDMTGGTHAISGVLRVGRDGGSVGQFFLSGSSVLSSGELNVGMSGTGTFTQTGGTYTLTNTLYVAKEPPGVGRYTLSSGILTAPSEIVGNLGTGTFDMTGGRHSVTGALTIGNGGAGTFNLAGGSLTTGSAVVNGALLASAGSASFGAMTGTGSIAASGVGSITASSIRVNLLTVSGASLVSIVPNGGNSGASKINAITFSGGTFDVNDNDLIVTGGTYGPVSAAIISARNDGAWDGPGLSSSSARNHPNGITTLGLLSGAEYDSVAITPGTFDALTYLSGSMLVKYTYYGDSNFDGDVTLDDYAFIDGGFLLNLTGWLNGDYDYSGGKPTLDDYALIDGAYLLKSGLLIEALTWLEGGGIDPLRDESGLQRVAQHYGLFGEGYVESLLAVVPEPGLAAPLLFVAASLIRRRRSHLA
ncbi:MAG: beta strand repeat-containing protein [Tepidisphaeraceae bacterium]